MREKTELIEEQVVDDGSEYNWCDIINLIEFSYMIKGRKEIEKLEELIREVSMDGINTWGIFIKHCYDKFNVPYFIDYSLDEFINEQLENCVSEFINKYFEDDKNNVYVVYQLGYTGTSQLDILGIYSNIGEARQKYKTVVEENIKEYDYAYDKECTNHSYNDGTANMTRLFKGGLQENWDNYLEIHIEKREIK